MSAKPLQVIVFDLFHTLVDPEMFRPKDYKRTWVAADLLGLDREDFSAYWQATSQKRMLTKRRAADYLADYVMAIGQIVPVSLIEEADFALRRYQDEAILNPPKDVLFALEFLKQRDLKLGLLSNSYEGDVREWHHSPLKPYFHTAIFSHEVGMAKPDPEVFRHALKKLGDDGSGSMFVGDGNNEELRGARRAGFAHVVFMKRFVATNGLRTPAELEEAAKEADFSIDDYSQLVKRVVEMK